MSSRTSGAGRWPIGLSFAATLERVMQRTQTAGRQSVRRRITRALVPDLLRLEDRRLLSTFDVTSTADDGSTGTLGWAVSEANAAASASAIVFELGTGPATITLASGPGHAGTLELSNTSASVMISDGPGQGPVTVSGSNGSDMYGNIVAPVFSVDAGVTASLSGLTITGGGAGGLSNQGTVTLSDCVISDNSGGGFINSSTFFRGVDNYATATLTGCTISGNSATYGGGGLRNDAGTATLTNCTISGNIGADGGGLRSYESATTLTNCTISDNSATYGGGGLYNGGGLGTYKGKATLTNCTISGNSAAKGGGVENFGSAAAFTDCTISGNTASEGGGLYGAEGAYSATTLSDCTISGNTASSSGGGIYVYSGQFGSATVALTDTIVAGNAGSGGSASDIGGNGAASGATGTFNLIGTGGSGGLASADNNLLNVTDPGLASLASNGGPTETMALLPGSPAIGAGTQADYPGSTTAITTDQRGQPLDSTPDIGAYQTQAPQAINLSFTGLNSPAITYGTASVTLSGFLASGNQAPPDTESVEVTLDGITQSAAIGTGGAFSTTFDTGTLGASGSPYAISYAYTSDGTYASTGTTGTLTVSRARPTVKVADAGGTFTGKAFPGTATVSGVGGITSSSLETVAPTLTYYAGSSATGSPLAGAPSQAGTYTVVAGFAGSVDYAANTSGPVSFTIDKATSTVALTAADGSAVFGQTVTFVAIVTAGAATPTGTLTFYDGSTPLGTAALNASGKATLTSSALAIGSQSITAGYGGDGNLLAATSRQLAELVARAATQVVMVPLPRFKKKKLVSLGLEAEVGPISPGSGVPTGTVTFEVQVKSNKKAGEKVLGIATLRGGSATLTLNPSTVLNKPIKIVFGGDADFASSTVPTTTLTQKRLTTLARTIQL